MDADFDVNLYEAVKLLIHYGAKAGHPECDPNCNIDGDGDIDLYDAVRLLTNHGQEDPQLGPSFLKLTKSSTYI